MACFADEDCSGYLGYFAVVMWFASIVYEHVCSGGQLRDKEGRPFVFKVHDSHEKNQKRYESIGEVGSRRWQFTCSCYEI